MRDRKEPVPSEDSLEVAKRVKEMYSYVCPDMAKEFKKFDEKPDKYFKQYSGVKKTTGKNLVINEPLIAAIKSYIKIFYYT